MKELRKNLSAICDEQVSKLNSILTPSLILLSMEAVALGMLTQGDLPTSGNNQKEILDKIN